jgi:hypothetical protein
MKKVAFPFIQALFNQFIKNAKIGKNPKVFSKHNFLTIDVQSLCVAPLGAQRPQVGASSPADDRWWAYQAP